MRGKARYLEADRAQLGWDMVDLESQLASDHRARVVWAFVTSLDLSALYDRIRAREGLPGRPPPDPQIFLALWLYATLEGVGSARHLDRLCQSDTAYRWLRGGVAMNYHDLSDFRVGHADVLDRLLTDSLTALMAEGIVKLEEVAVDGTKVRAWAGRGSFRGAEKLARLERWARERVDQLRGSASDAGASEGRRRAAQQRGAEEVARRAGEASHTLEKLRAEQAKRTKTHKKEEEAKKAKTEVKASVSDPEAWMMRFADGAVRAAYNIQLAVAPETGIIVAAATTDRRNDTGLAVPVVEQIKDRLKILPQRLLADSRYATKKDIVTLAGQGVTVYMPVPADKPDAKPESQRKRDQNRSREPEAVKAWRERMDQEESKAIYRRRGRIETVNGILKGRGLGIMRVRSIAKVTAVVLMQALAHNLWRAHCLRASPA
jgi:transposase